MDNKVVLLYAVGLKGQSENEEAIENLRCAQKAKFTIYVVSMDGLACIR